MCCHSLLLLFLGPCKAPQSMRWRGSAPAFCGGDAGGGAQRLPPRARLHICSRLALSCAAPCNPPIHPPAQLLGAAAQGRLCANLSVAPAQAAWRTSAAAYVPAQRSSPPRRAWASGGEEGRRSIAAPQGPQAHRGAPPRFTTSPTTSSSRWVALEGGQALPAAEGRAAARALMTHTYDDTV